MKPIRVQRFRNKKNESPNGLDVKYVGRPTKYGNPFRVVRCCGKWKVITSVDFCAKILTDNCKLLYDTKEQAALDAVKCYEMYILPYKKNGGTLADFYRASINLDDIIEELRGKNLSCWCSVDSPCHADVLLKIANCDNF
jgi:hypothetical protein